MARIRSPDRADSPKPVSPKQLKRKPGATALTGPL
jgi:hypothetical protein